MMLFKHEHLLKELRKNGRQGDAEILSMTTVGEGGSMRAGFTPDDDLSNVWSDVRMTLLVIPQDRSEPPFETTVMTRIHTWKHKGSHVPAWYDPNDRSKVVVDYEEDRQNFEIVFAATPAEAERAALTKKRAH